MYVNIAVIFCLKALLIQGFTAQYIGPYNGYKAAKELIWPAANSWEGNMAWPASNSLAWDTEPAAYNGFAAGNWPNTWEGSTAWPASNPFSREDAAFWGRTTCAGSEFAGPYATASWVTDPFVATEWGVNYSPASLSASNGGGLAVSSASSIAPTGVSMNSENIYEGPLAVSGAVPFLSAVALEGVLPTGGAGAIAYNSGNGNVAMLKEDYGSGYGIGSFGYNAGIDNYGYGAGFSSPAYGYNGFSSPGYGYNDYASPIAIQGVAESAYSYYGSPGGRQCGCGNIF